MLEMPGKLLVSRRADPALEDGLYSIAVTYLGAGRPVVRRRPVKKVAVQHYRVVRPQQG